MAKIPIHNRIPQPLTLRARAYDDVVSRCRFYAATKFDSIPEERAISRSKTSALRGTNLFVASGGGLSSFDVGDPAHPRLLARLPLPVRAVHIDVHGTTAAIVGSSPAPTLVLVDVGRPDAPIIERTVPLPEQSRPTSVALTGTRALVAAGAAGVVVVER